MTRIKSLSQNRLGEGDSPILLRRPAAAAAGARRQKGTVPGGFWVGSFAARVKDNDIRITSVCFRDRKIPCRRACTAQPALPGQYARRESARAHRKTAR